MKKHMRCKSFGKGLEWHDCDVNHFFIWTKRRFVGEGRIDMLPADLYQQQTHSNGTEHSCDFPSSFIPFEEHHLKAREQKKVQPSEERVWRMLCSRKVSLILLNFYKALKDLATTIYKSNIVRLWGQMISHVGQTLGFDYHLGSRRALAIMYKQILLFKWSSEESWICSLIHSIRHYLSFSLL